MSSIPKRVVVICLGNICRSPVAQFLLQNYARQSNNPSVRVITFDSAGLGGGNYGIERSSQEFLEEKGIHPGAFVSKHTSRPFFDSFDLIIVLEHYMKREILQDYYDQEPMAIKDRIAAKILTLREAAGENGDIPDPYGLPYDMYRTIIQEIDRICAKIVAHWDFES